MRQKYTILTVTVWVTGHTETKEVTKPNVLYSITILVCMCEYVPVLCLCACVCVSVCVCVCVCVLGAGLQGN